jgi:hypothetical protein
MRLTCTVNGQRREVDGGWEGESLPSWADYRRSRRCG